MERLLHYVWKYKLYLSDPLTTTDGIPVVVIDPGTSHTDAGPDFFNAKVRIGDTVWAGSIELHRKASDWKLHKHQEDKVYDTVILHVTECDDATVFRSNGEAIPQVVLAVPDSVRQNMEWLLHTDHSLPCRSLLHEIDPVHLSGWFSTLLGERLERKVQDIYRLLDQYNNDWNEVFYILLTRTFGVGLNNDAFEWLAKSLPLRCIQKQRSSHSQVEALLFGQAGMLDAEKGCHYYRLLQREYRFLQNKYQLKPLDLSLFKNLRIRPGSFPHLKLAQLAAIWAQHDTLFSVLREARTIRQIKDVFRVQPDDYWKTHYHFDHASPEKEKPIGEGTINILLINTIVPLFFAWGERNKQPEYTDRAIRILEALPAEQNHIVTAFCQAGITVQNASDTQALIQLKRMYCEPKKCLYCRIGFRLLKRSLSLDTPASNAKID